jgi:rhodanese-related sulfurtransferase
MSIPGGICCPNGELALRVRDLVPDPRTKIIVNCAGRTRSIIGAQMLIDFGVPNPVYALQNGTQGWSLAGLMLERNAQRCYRSEVGGDVGELAGRARALAATHGAGLIAVNEANGWCGDRARTTYLLDVRSPEEFARRPIAGFVHAPGGQLLQATDQWVGVRGARLLLLDDEGVRAPVVAAFLRQLGHEAYVLEGGSAAAAAWSWQRPSPDSPPPLATISAAAVAARVRQGACIIDLRAATSFRRGHIAGARWSIRPRLAALRLPSDAQLVLATDDPAVAALAGRDLAELGHADVRTVAGGPADWAAAGLPLQASADDPADADMIDFLFFTAGRHEGDGDAARRYLAWEVGLIGQLDAQERAAFRIPCG